jgi:hypothetical protein
MWPRGRRALHVRGAPTPGRGRPRSSTCQPTRGGCFGERASQRRALADLEAGGEQALHLVDLLAERSSWVGVPNWRSRRRTFSIWARKVATVVASTVRASTVRAAAMRAAAMRARSSSVGPGVW